MAVSDRTERYSKIRGWLDYPYSQRPRPNLILQQMLKEEQWLNLRLGNEGEAWNLIQTELVTVVGQTEYTITQPVSANQTSGKVYMVLRSTEDENLPYVSVPFDDLSELNYGKMPADMTGSLAIPERVAVYRTGMQDQVRKVVLQPTPQEVLNYEIWFYTGALDGQAALMTKTGLVTELSDFLDIKAAMALLPYCKWSDSDRENSNKRRELLEGLERQYNDLRGEAMDYIDNMNGESAFDLGMWNDRD